MTNAYWVHTVAKTTVFVIIPSVPTSAIAKSDFLQLQMITSIVKVSNVNNNDNDDDNDDDDMNSEKVIVMIRIMIMKSLQWL